MGDKIALVRIKCGQIFFLSDDKFSWVCEFCDKDFYSLEDFRPHINEHFPKPLTSIKRENSISCGSDYEAFPMDVIRDDNSVKDSRVDNEQCLLKTPMNIKIEDSLSYGSERDDVMSFEDIMKYEATSQKFGSSILTDNQFKKITIKSEPSERKPPKPIHSNGNAHENNTKMEVSSSKRNRIKNKLNEAFKCTLCKKLFGGKKELNDHENVHTGKRPHQCEICFVTFASSSNMRRHVKVHKDDRRHQCKVCKKRFVVRSKLSIHVREKHLPDTDTRRYFSCELCDAQFKSYAKLYIHRRIHRENTAVFICYYCNTEFERREQIVLHMKVHFSKKT